MKNIFKNIFCGILLGLIVGCDSLVQKIPLPTPEAAFEVVDQEFVAPCQVSFFNKSYFATSYEWDAGTGRLYEEREPNIYFADAGVYTLKLTVFNVDGESDTYEQTIEILGDPTVPVRSPWAGKWIVKSEEPLTEIGTAFSDKLNFEGAKKLSNMADLTSTQITGWPAPILVRNSNFDPSDIKQSEIKAGENGYVAIGYINQGDINTQQFFNITVRLDGKLVIDFLFQGILPAMVPYYNYDIFLGQLEAGTHTVSLELDRSNLITESDETNNIYTIDFEVQPHTTFDSFEFVESRFLARFAQNQTKYGELYYDDGTLYMGQIGAAKILENTENEMTLLIDDYAYHLEREVTSLVQTDQTKRLTQDVWIHSVSTADMSKGAEWVLTANGTYVYSFQSSHYVLDWTYVDETHLVLHEDTDRSLTILDLTNTRLYVEDELSELYKMNPAAY